MDDKILKGYLAKHNVTIESSNCEWFNEAEKQEALGYWETYQRELLSKITIRWTYNGQIRFV